MMKVPRRSLLYGVCATLLAGCGRRNNHLVGRKLRLARITSRQVVIVELDGENTRKAQHDLGGYTGAWDIARGRMFFAVPNAAMPESRILTMDSAGNADIRKVVPGWVSRLAASLDGLDLALLTRSSVGGKAEILKLSLASGVSTVLATRFLPPHHAGSANLSLAWSREHSLLAYCDRGAIDLMHTESGITIEHLDGSSARFSTTGRLAWAQGEALCVREVDGKLRRIQRDRRLIGVHGWLEDDKTVLISERTSVVRVHHYARWCLLNVEDGSDFELNFAEVPHHLVLNG